MSDLIIAPTIAFSHKPPSDTIIGAQNPYTAENVMIKEKIVPMTVNRPSNVPKEMKNKRIENLQAVKNGERDIDTIARQRAEYEIITQYKNMTYFPDVAVITGNNTNKVIGGTINDVNF